MRHLDWLLLLLVAPCVIATSSCSSEEFQPSASGGKSGDAGVGGSGGSGGGGGGKGGTGGTGGVGGVAGSGGLPADCKTDPDCDDGKACTGKETCSAGKCVAGTEVKCPNPDAAHCEGVCEEAAGGSSTCLVRGKDADGDKHLDKACTASTATADDCDDGNKNAYPGATESCDGVDNDCNGLSDERDGCVDLDSDPLIIGCIRADKTTIAVGEQVTLKTFVFDGDGDNVSYSWQQDSKLTAQGYNGLDLLAAPSVTFTAPAAIEGNKDKETYTFAVQVADPSMNVDFCNIDITVVAEGGGECEVQESTVKSGCGGGSSALLVPGAFGLLALARRRKDRKTQA